MNILFDVYDSVGDVPVDSETVILFNMPRFLNRGVSLLSGEINLSPSLSRFMPPYSYTLLLLAKVSLDVSSGNNRTQSKAWIEVDIGLGYEVVPGTDGYMYNRTAGAGFGSATINTTYQISKIIDGVVKFRIRAQKLEGSNDLITLAQASNFIGMIDL